ncbi:sucrase ferredoxin [Actinocrinis sp.]|uniref:sucrase ferredoxin n=1 Tax=Actinocrinis sp. TaxID=1920516 RepID=UPI002C52ACEE|nr:sucrase ferredoxin [Actinocrinis sp.]HXR70924.1 sucrase ferredoxin [Actinocrinis sp.]
MPSHPAARTAPSNCSVFSATLHEPLAGTAPVASAWLAIEQPGPWGARALTQSHLDPEIGAELGRRAEALGLRIALIRRVGRHALTDPTARRTALLCNTRPGAATVRAVKFSDPGELLDLNLGDLVAGRFAEGELLANPVMLVCTNGKRDQCCAERGRALALDLAQREAARDGVQSSDVIDVWESDHLGGHRFAPTAVVLPTGYVYGRLDADAALAALDAARGGQVMIENARGRSTWSRAGQAADLALRTELQQFDADAVWIVAEERTGEDSYAVELSVDDDTRYRATVHGAPASVPRPESCGKALGNPIELRVTELEKLP